MFNFKRQIGREIDRVEFLLNKIPETDGRYLSGSMVKRRSKGKVSYYWERSKMFGKERKKSQELIGETESEKVMEFATARVAHNLRKSLEQNRAVLQKAYRDFKDYDIASILSKMPPSYSEIISNAKAIDLNYDKFRDGIISKKQKEKLGGTLGLPSPPKEVDMCIGYTRAQVEWANGDYERNPVEMKTRHVAADGTAVRSKNETIIYNMLLSYGIPFRYECGIELRNDVGIAHQVFPDFTIMNRMGGLIAYEHLGLLSESRYRTNLIEKLALYEQSGYSLLNNLFITMDYNGEIDTEAIDKMITEFILPQI